MTYLLDTVAVSELAKFEPVPEVIEYLSSLNEADVYLSVVTIAEFRKGIVLMPLGQKRIQLERFHERITGHHAERILDVNQRIAWIWGELDGRLKSSGINRRSAADLLIAATALHHDLTVITRNVTDFEPTGCKILNPWHQVS